MKKKFQDCTIEELYKLCKEQHDLKGVMYSCTNCPIGEVCGFAVCWMRDRMLDEEIDV